MKNRKRSCQNMELNCPAYAGISLKEARLLRSLPKLRTT
ncbi:hypothetical protein Golob_028109 [Gossypium lobatum]|uniref:Uncharacterized protein n=1 Tax=Gossypium lobatum TaxID=34289 RepID=A0A7J8NEJ7_9ROSI|nr:hypothetical protein [Gossypium lobatum]